MKNSTARHLLQYLSAIDRARFVKFLKSPYFNHRTDVIAAFEWMHRQYPPDSDFEQNTDKDKVELYAALFPKTKYDNRKLNHLLSYLADRLERFMAVEEILSDPTMDQLYRCKSFRKRGMSAHFERNVAILAKEHRQSPLRNAGFWLMDYQIQNEIFAHRIVQHRDGDTNFEVATQALSHFFRIENLRWAATASSLSALTRSGLPPLPLLDATIETALSENETALALALEAFRTQANPDNTAYFERLKPLLIEHAHLFPPAESRDFFMSAINFAIRRHNRGEKTYTREAFDLYRQALERKLLFENGILPSYTYVNILNLAQLVGENDWALHFLETYSPFLSPSERENMHRYGLASFHFRQSNYRKVLELLREVEFTGVFIQLDARKMLIRAFYETGEWGALHSLLDSFSVFLRRRKELGYHRESYLNLIKYTKKLVYVSTASKQKRRLLADKISAIAAFAEKDWVLSKLGF